MRISEFKGENIMLNMTELYYFSPTGGTKKVGESFCEEISENITLIDLGKKNDEIEKPVSDIVVVAVPVFGGRIPAIVIDKLSKLNGSAKKAITLVVYGNRAYEDALLELNNVISESGFQVIASGAFVTQHSIVPEVGKGRPDNQDMIEIHDFAEKVLDKLENGAESTVEVPGNYPYKTGTGMSVTPISLSVCNQCKKCKMACPTEAIQIEQGSVNTNTEKCILCMACVAACPEHARILPASLQEKMEQKLGAFKAVRGKNEYFL